MFTVTMRPGGEPWYVRRKAAEVQRAIDAGARVAIRVALHAREAQRAAVIEQACREMREVAEMVARSEVEEEPRNNTRSVVMVVRPRDGGAAGAPVPLDLDPSPILPAAARVRGEM